MTPSDCQHCLEQMDLALDAATPPPHLEGCPACAAEWALRQRVRIGLRRAVQTEVAGPEFQTRLRTAIRAEARGGFRRQWSQLAAAAALLLGLGGVIAYQLGHLRLTAESQESYLSGISKQVSNIMQVGLQDHVHCAVFNKAPHETQTADQMIAEMAPRMQGLAKLVKQNISSEYEVVEAHHCEYRHRRFVHMALSTKDGKLVSVLLTRKQAGESFAQSGLRPVLRNPEFSLYREGVQRFQLAGFESREFLAYVISDMTAERNQQLATVIAPVMQGYLDKPQG